MDKPDHAKAPRPFEIHCTACGQDSIVRREPVYDGFTRTGESLRCAACGHVFPDEASVPYKTKKTMPGFSRQDVPPPPRVFTEADVRTSVGTLCRHCAHYVVNPFLQRCGLTRRQVEATDTCGQFAPKPPPDPAPEPPPAKPAF
jgi:hypothetical protein